MRKDPSDRPDAFVQSPNSVSIVMVATEQTWPRNRPRHPESNSQFEPDEFHADQYRGVLLKCKEVQSHKQPIQWDSMDPVSSGGIVNRV